MIPGRSMLADFVDLVCLVYHEARWARSADLRSRLPDGLSREVLPLLPEGRRPAWRAMEGVRAKAYGAASTREVERIFSVHYGVGLEGLEQLFDSGDWASTSGRVAFGGPRWAEVCRRVAALGRAMNGSDEVAIADAASSVLEAKHNHGGPNGVHRKLKGLRRGSRQKAAG